MGDSLQQRGPYELRLRGKKDHGMFQGRCGWNIMSWTEILIKMRKEIHRQELDQTAPWKPF